MGLTPLRRPEYESTYRLTQHKKNEKILRDASIKVTSKKPSTLYVEGEAGAVTKTGKGEVAGWTRKGKLGLYRGTQRSPRLEGQGKKRV